MEDSLRRILPAVVAALALAAPAAAQKAVFADRYCVTNNVAHAVAGGLSTVSPPAADVSTNGTAGVTFAATPPAGLALDAWYAFSRAPNAEELAGGTNALAASSASTAFPPAYELSLNAGTAPFSAVGTVFYLIPAYSWLRYSLVYDGNGATSGTAPATSSGLLYPASVTLAQASSLAKTGHTFANWCTNSAGRGTAFAAGASKTGADFGATTAGVVRLYAKWTANAYAVAFDGNGGTGGSMSAQQFTYGVPQALSANAFTKTGCGFAGWNRKADGSGAAYADGATVSNLTATAGATVTLYARWTTNAYTVAFDANGGDGSMSAQQFTYGVSQALSANAFTRTGYTYAGWNTKADGSGVSYADKASVSSLTATDGATVTLYAQWTANTYELAFDNDFQCLEWRSSASCALKNAASDSSLGCQDGWPEIYAGSHASVQTLGGAGSGYYNVAASGGTQYTFSCTLTGNAPSSAVYWIALDSGYAVISNGTSAIRGMGKSQGATSYVKRFTTPASCAYLQLVFYVTDRGEREVFSDLRLCRTDPYGAVSVSPVRVEFTYCGGTAYRDCATSDGGVVGGFPAPTRTGWTFQGWFTEQSGGSQVTADDEAAAANRVLRSRWTENGYKVAFNGNGGSGTMAAVTTNYTASFALPVGAFSRTGYSFAGWNTKANGTGTPYADGATVAKLSATDGATVTLYAQWTANGYTVVFDANGGEGAMPSSARSWNEAFALPACAFSRTGYAFSSWTNSVGEAFADGATVSNLASSAGAVVALYATWTPNTYTIHYDGNGADSLAVHSMADSAGVAFDVPFELSANNYRRAGFAFSEWNRAADGSGTAYADGATVLNLATNQDAVATLYAQWTTNGYTVVFDANGGEGAMEGLSCLYGIEYTLPTNAFAKSGFTFAGWLYDTSHVLADGAAFSNLTESADATVTLVAQWEDAGGDLKSALDIPADVRDSVTVWCSHGEWTVHAPSADEDVQPVAGDSFLTATTANTGNCDLSLAVTGGGTLSFYWMAADESVKKTTPILQLYVDGEYRMQITGEDVTWREKVVADLSDLGEGEHVILWRLVDRQRADTSQTACLDCVSWTPAAAAGEPTEADAPVITEAGIAEGDFTLSFEATGAFRYILQASDTLVPPAWADIATNVTTSAETVSFGELYDPDKPQRFFRVRVEGLGEAQSGGGEE